MFPIYMGKPILPSKTVMYELRDTGMDLYDVLHILEDGFDCYRSRRSKNIVERCETKGGKVLKVVVADMHDHWKLIHVGKTTASKKYFRRLR